MNDGTVPYSNGLQLIDAGMIKRAARVLHSHYGISPHHLSRPDTDLAAHILVEALQGVVCKDGAEVRYRIAASRGDVPLPPEPTSPIQINEKP